MTDLREILGDRYDEVIERAARAHASIEPGGDWPTNAALGGNLTGTRDDEYRAGMREQAEEVLAAVLPDLLAEANTRANDAEAKARRFANMLGNNAKALNDVLPREVLRQKAAAWDEGHLAGCSDPYSAYGECGCGPNPYRRDSEGAEAGA